MKSHGVCADILDLDFANIPTCDIVIGGPPCQGFSVAGKMCESDPRSQLVFSFLDVVKHTKARAFVMENVPHLAKSSKFADIRRRIRLSSESMGYTLTMWILNAKDFGVAQSRERVFFVGIKQGMRQPSIPIGKKSGPSARDVLSILPAPGVEPNLGVCRAKVVPAKNPVLRKSPYAGMLFNGQGRPINLDGVANTLPASMGGNRTPIIDEEQLRNPDSPSWISRYYEHRMSGQKKKWQVPSHVRRITVTEAKLLQGFPIDYTLLGTQCTQYRLIGNSVPPPLAEAVATAVLPSFK